MSEPEILRPPQKKRVHFWRRLLWFSVLAGIAVVAVGVPLLVKYYGRAQAFDLQQLDQYNETTVVFDRGGEELGRLFTENRTVLRGDEIPEMMKRAVIAVEDRRFYEHGGVDVQGLARAMVRNVRHGGLQQGGSTITQQLAKNALGQFERSFERKFIELFLALRIEKHFTKDQILNYYLNRIYFGGGYFGLEAAAQGYFGKSANDMTLGECAMLAGIIRSPNSCSPRRDLRKAVARRDVALSLLSNQGFVSSDKAALARQQGIRIQPRQMSGVTSHALAWVVQELDQALNLGGEQPGSGLRVFTTLDAGMQRQAEESLKQRLSAVRAAGDLGHEKSQDPLQGAALVLDHATGAVRVYVGGRDFFQSHFDRVSQARRENGALLQPFIHLLGMQRLGLHPASMINASFLEGLGDSAGGLGDPDEDLHHRFLTLQDALALANRSAASRVALDLGPDKIVQWLRSQGAGAASSGIEQGRLLNPITLREVSKLYQRLANGGEPCEPFILDRVVDAADRVLFDHDQTQADSVPSKPGREPQPSAKAGEHEESIPRLLARQMTLTLQGSIRDGVSRSLVNDLNFPSPVAGMSGYSDGYRDAWFAGFTPSVTGVVWVGYDQSRPIGTKAECQGIVLPLWADILGAVVEGETEGAAFEEPKELVRVEVERRTGAVRGLAGMVPSPGGVFSYLTQQQIDSIKNAPATAAAQVKQSDDWSDWLATLFADVSPSPTGEGAAALVGVADIPVVAEYRMPGLRGDIVLSDGTPVATMGMVQSLVLPWPSTETAPDTDSALAWVAERMSQAASWLGSPPSISDMELRSCYKFQRFHPILVADSLTPEQVAAFETSGLPAEGFVLQGYPRRVYPQGKMLSHTLGYLRRKQGRNWGRYVAGEVIYDDYEGGMGVEELLDAELRGEEGRFVIQTTPDGFTQRARVEKEAGFGKRVRIAVDGRLQAAVEKAAESMRAGAVVVLDPTNGDVKALASRPDFSPAEFLPALPASRWQALATGEKHPLLHRVHRQMHPPGSVFKVITAMAGISAGVFDENRVVNCPGYFMAGTFRFNLPKETRPVAFHEAMAYSFNTYFMDMGTRAGREALVKTAREFGTGSLTGFDLPGELKGLMPDSAYVLARHSRIMGAGDVANASIGQGDVLMTPLQMANAMAAVANGGTLYRPRLVLALEEAQGNATQVVEPRVIGRASLSSQQMQVVRLGMEGVTISGTGRRAQVPGVRVASKSGTAQVGSKAQPRQIAWFAGFLPVESPEFAFAIMVEGDFDQSLSGGTDAGAMAGQIFREYYDDDAAVTPKAEPVSPAR